MWKNYHDFFYIFAETKTAMGDATYGSISTIICSLIHVDRWILLTGALGIYISKLHAVSSLTVMFLELKVYVQLKIRLKMKQWWSELLKLATNLNLPPTTHFAFSLRYYSFRCSVYFYQCIPLIVTAIWGTIHKWRQIFSALSALIHK